MKLQLEIAPEATEQDAAIENILFEFKPLKLSGILQVSFNSSKHEGNLLSFA